jgi:predicted AlkP superfamily phosphohydrolase/phosphomutase
MQKLKSLVLGLDGGTWDVLLPLIDLGVIPNIGKLVGRGARGVLKSTFPPTTGPAWTTFATGKNPGHHGFVDWGLLDEEYYLRMWSAAQVPDQTLWTRLSDAGRRVGVFNVPFSYPPDSINGFVVCGMGTPGHSYAWTHPPELKDQIAAELGERYILSLELIPYAADEYDRLVDDLIALEEQRTAILLRRLEEYQLDDLIVVYTGTDRVGHFLGHCADFGDRSGLDSLTPEQAAVIRYYRALDQHVGRVLEWVGPDTAVAVVSDHGFAAKDKVFYINEWLRRRGYLATTPLSRLKSRLAYLSGALQREKPSSAASGPSEDDEGIAGIVYENRFNTGLHLGQRIDWSRTRAFSNSHNGLYINTVGRFAHGIVQPGAECEALRERLTTDLLAIRDPQSGRPVVEAVYTREQVYVGPKLEQTPDLLLRFRDDRYMSNRYFFAPQDFGLIIGTSAFGRPIHWGRGDHHHDGILLLAGPSFRGGAALEPTSIENVTPTMLHVLGMPIPTGMTGQVIAPALTEEHRRAHTVETVDDPALKPEADLQGGMSAEEEKLVYERLRDLGYLE